MNVDDETQPIDPPVETPTEQHRTAPIPQNTNQRLRALGRMLSDDADKQVTADRIATESALNEEQRLLLETASRLKDAEGFEERDPTFNEQAVLRPADDVLVPIEELNAIPAPTIRGVDVRKPVDPIAKQDVKAGATVQSTMTYTQRVALDGVEKKVESILPARGTVVGDKQAKGTGDLRATPRPMTPEAKLGAVLVSLAVLVFGAGIYYKSQSSAAVEREQLKETAQLASESAESKSAPNQMHEAAFRLPQGAATGSGGAPIGGSGPAVGIAQGAASGWTPSKHPFVAPTAQQLGKNAEFIKAAEDMEAVGQHEQAAAILSAALSKSPGDVRLRMAVVHAYILMKDFDSARVICQEGMRAAASAEDYNLLAGMLGQIPAR